MKRRIQGRGADHRESYAGGGVLFVPITKTPTPRRRLSKDPVASGFYYTHTLNCLLFH